MDLFEQALLFAVSKHSGQRRKITGTPYILHPVEVATIASTMSDDMDLIIAALLHDTVEDTDTTFDEIELNFGKRVSLLVMTETEEKRPELPASETWQLRKEESLVMLNSTRNVNVKMLWLSDKLSNMRSFYREYRKNGNEVFEHLNQKDPSKHAWYYISIALVLKELKDYDAYIEYATLVKKVFADYLGDYDEF